MTLAPRFCVSASSTTVLLPLLGWLQPHMTTTPAWWMSGRLMQPAAAPPAMAAPLRSRPRSCHSSRCRRNRPGAAVRHGSRAESAGEGYGAGIIFAAAVPSRFPISSSASSQDTGSRHPRPGSRCGAGAFGYGPYDICTDGWHGRGRRDTRCRRRCCGSL